MYKIKLFGIREEEIPMATAWADKHQIDLTYTSDELTMDNVHTLKGFDGVTIDQVSNFDQSLYPALEELGMKQLSMRTAGFDVHDPELAAKHGLVLTNVASYSPESIAEYAVMGTLNLLRHALETQTRIENQNYSAKPEIRGKTIHDKTVAVIGVGKIGSAVARIFNGFGARVLGFDIEPQTQYQSLVEYQDSLISAIKEADIVTIHMPLTEDTYHQFNLDIFKQFKKEAIFINTARGGIVDTNDLLKALDQDLISGAFIDVYEFESPYADRDCGDEVIEDEVYKALQTHPKVIYTPHTAYYTDTSLKNMIGIGLQSVVDVLNTGTSPNRLN